MAYPVIKLELRAAVDRASCPGDRRGALCGPPPWTPGRSTPQEETDDIERARPKGCQFRGSRPGADRFGGHEGIGMAAVVYDRVKRRLGSHPHPSPRSAVHDRGGRRRSAPPAARGRGALGPLRSSPRSARRASGFPARCFDGTEVLFPPGTQIAEDAAANWILLEADGSPSASACRRAAIISTTCRSTGASGIDPRKFRPVSDIPDEHLKILGRLRRGALREHRLCDPGLGVRRLFPRPEPDHRPRQQRDAGLPNEWMMMLMTKRRPATR